MIGLDLSPAGLAVGLLVSAVGLGLFLYGKRAARIPQLLTGMALMALPIFVSGALLTLAIGAGMVAAMWAAAHFSA